jgi:hypothetical protein
MLWARTPCVSATVDTMRGTISSSSSIAFRLKRAIVGFRPEAGAGSGVHELHGHANLGSRLPDAAFHHVARAQFLTAAHVHCPGIARGRTARNNAKIGEFRQTGDNVVGEAVGQRRKIGIAPLYLNGSTATQKPSSARDGARVGQRLWLGAGVEVFADVGFRR